MEYKVSYSNRKSIGIYVHKDGTVEVRCPFGTLNSVIVDVVKKKEDWIKNAISKVKEKDYHEFTDEEKYELIRKGNEIIPKKVSYFAKIMGVTPSSVRIGISKSYWGCCSGTNRINFSWRLMSMSDNIIDYVVVHELAHIKEHNHSKRFWNEVEKVLPNYRKMVEELKKYN